MFIKTSTTNETTWAALKAAVDNGTIAQGDLIVFNLKNGEEVAVRATQDKKGKWFFVLEDCLADEHCMNKRPTNKGAWAACDMRAWLNKQYGNPHVTDALDHAGQFVFFSAVHTGSRFIQQ